jgi:prepilin-type N-terminal cleavage/methylation domain-containing protein
VKKGFTLIELLIVVAIIAILAAIAVPNFLEAQVRAKVSRVKNDQRSLATGIESYYVDNNTYPVSARTSRQPAANMINYNGGLAQARGDTNAQALLAGISTFSSQNPVAGNAVGIATLTTPVAYITSYFADPFADFKGATFGYYDDSVVPPGARSGWILWSPGPDTDTSSYTDLGAGGPATPLVETLYTGAVAQPSPQLIAYQTTTFSTTYDSTNGTVSSGDVWRVKQ